VRQDLLGGAETYAADVSKKVFDAYGPEFALRPENPPQSFQMFCREFGVRENSKLQEGVVAKISRKSCFFG
jgi:hypothetical protein